MRRCFELAQKGVGYTAPNPMVGAVLVHEDTIIGEGYHANYGQAHAEVNCINSVAESNRNYISKSTMYVSLEPCVHFGKTPPCTNLIVEHSVPKVVIGCKDSFAAVNGRGIEILKDAGIEVITGILERESIALNNHFFTFHNKQRPYVILKWAQSNNEKIAGSSSERLHISNDICNRIVHKWRSETAAIFVGTQTALKDNPALTTRLVTGNNPVRLVIDKQLALPAHLKLFDGAAKTIVFNFWKNEEAEKVIYRKIKRNENAIKQILHFLYKENIQSVLVEGGAKLLQSFLNAGLWDEARIITNTSLHITNGLSAPVLAHHHSSKKEAYSNDVIQYFINTYNE